MADEQQPADDLRSLLAGAFDESAAAAVSTTDTAPAAKPERGDDASAPAVADTKAGDDKADRPRGEDGKFVKKDDADADKGTAKADADKAKAEPKADDDKAAAAKASDDKAKDAEPKADATRTDAKEPPANWSASDKAMFKLQSQEAQDFLLRRHAAMEGDYTKKVQQIAELKKEYEPVAALFAPHLDVLKQKGMTPQIVIKRWADVETALANGRGIDIIDGIVKGYGIDKAELGRRLGFTSTPSGQASTDPGTGGTDAARPAGDGAPSPIQLPPQVAEELRQLREGLNAIKQTEQNSRLQAQQERVNAVDAEISQFRSAVNEKGELLHPYFEEVEPAMIALAQSYVASKQPLPKIADLYDQAVWANPSTRQALLATQKAAQEAKAAEEARAKAASARRAASSVTGDPGPGQSTRPVRGELPLREQLEEAYSAVTG